MRTIRRLALAVLALLLPCCATPDARTADDAPEHGPPVILIAGDSYTCSAVVFERDTLMTAGHCIMNEVVHGVGYGQVVESDHTWKSPTADIGLVFLKKPFTSPALELPRVGGVPSPLSDGWVRGFGCALHEDGARKVRQDTRPVMSFGGLLDNGQLPFLGKICHGDSGGAYFDESGRLLGILSLGYATDRDGNATAGSAVPVADALEGLLAH